MSGSSSISRSPPTWFPQWQRSPLPRRAGYDSLGRLGTVVDHRLSGNQTTTYAYDDASNVATVTYPNGVTTQFTYDELNRVSALAASSSAAEVSGYTHQRDDAGKLTHVLELDNRTAAWTYDGINRLTGETVANAPGSKNGTVGYGLDPVGNRSSASSTISGLSPVSGGCPISPVVGDG